MEKKRARLADLAADLARASVLLRILEALTAAEVTEIERVEVYRRIVGWAERLAEALGNQRRGGME